MRTTSMSPISWIKGIVRRPLSPRLSRRSAPSPAVNESLSSEASQPKPPSSDVAQEGIQSDLAQGLESLWRDIPQHESNEDSGKEDKTPDQKHSLGEAIFTKASDVPPVPEAGEMYDFQPYTQNTVNRLRESVSGSESPDYLEANEAPLSFVDKKPYDAQIMCVDQPLESLGSQGCADHDDKTGTKTAGLVGELQKHGSSGEEIMDPLPSERRIIAGGMPSGQDMCVISRVAEKQPVKDVVPVQLLPTDRRVIFDAADVAPMLPSPSECWEVSDDISRIAQRKPTQAENVALMRSLPLDREMISDDESDDESDDGSDAVEVSPVRPPPSECWEGSARDVSRFAQEQPAVEVSPIPSLTSECWEGSPSDVSRFAQEESAVEPIPQLTSESWEGSASAVGPIPQLTSECWEGSDAVEVTPLRLLVSDAVEERIDQATHEAYRRQWEAARIQDAKEKAERERAAAALMVQEKVREKREEARIQQKLRNLGVCVQGFQWIKQPSGYRCAGGSHFISDSQLR